VEEFGGQFEEGVLDRFVEGIFHLVMDHHQKQVIRMDLTLTQTQALRLLRLTAIPTSKLAAALGISAPAVTQLTDRLARKQLIERLRHEADRRSVRVGLTKKGQSIVDGFRQRRSEVFNEALSHLSEADRTQVIQSLAKITAVIETPQQVIVDPSGASHGERVEVRTPVQPREASKDVGQPPPSRPTKRMKIEWD